MVCYGLIKTKLIATKILDEGKKKSFAVFVFIIHGITVNVGHPVGKLAA